MARHVLAQFMYGGNLENETLDGHGNVVVQPKRCFGLLGRRQFLTLVIYLSTLIPALFLTDLGPVLSITGSLGASCIAYIATGLCYLALNGDDFLDYVRNSCESRQFGKSSAATNGEVELPVVGDASATMTTAPPPELGSSFSKPWWYWVCGYPIWTAIASTGSMGTRQFLASVEQPSPQAIAQAESIGPKKGDYFVSMFMIVFGVVAAVVGVASNIYVQVNDIFFTPS